MNKMILIALLLCGYGAGAQSKESDSLQKSNNQNAPSANTVPASVASRHLKSDDEIKAQLILLALNNPQVTAAEANVRIAEIARRKANSSLLSSITVAGNINEFVINKSDAANFWPKYNFGLLVPMDVFARNKAEKRTADEMITVNASQKQVLNDALKAHVLAQYEIYKEKKELLELQRIVMDDETATYEKAQKDYKEDRISIEEVNKIYREVLASRGYLITREKDLNIAIIEIEQIIGVPLKTVLEKP